MNNPAGYYVMSRYTSVAWCQNKEDAEKLARYLNYSGGTNYRVVKVHTV